MPVRSLDRRDLDDSDIGSGDEYSGERRLNGGQQEEGVEQLPRYQKYASGMRPKTNREELNSDESFQEVIVDYEQLMAILDDAEQAGRATFPDLSVLSQWEEEQERPFKAQAEMEDALRIATKHQVEESLQWEQEDEAPEETIFQDLPSLEFIEAKRLSELNTLKSDLADLSIRERNILMMEKHYRYEHPWWDSPFALVRLWGQLDCGIQVFSDAQLIHDLVEILGRNAIINESSLQEGRIFGFAYMVDNSQRLKNLIKAQYPEQQHVLNVIIRKQDNK
jgi:hypothetical protein